MSESKSDTGTPWTDPDDAPELDTAWFAQATLHEGGKPLNRGGRPRGSNKEQVTLRIDKAALAHFRAGGPGWQTRVNDALRKVAGL